MYILLNYSVKLLNKHHTVIIIDQFKLIKIRQF